MQKIEIRICSGTTCFVMGGGNLLMLEEKLPADLIDKINISGVSCIGMCKRDSGTKPPYVMINDTIIGNADIDKVIEEIQKQVLKGGKNDNK